MYKTRRICTRTQTSGTESKIPVIKKWREKNELGSPVTNMLRLQLNMNKVAKISVPITIEAK
jgi:hypothetical protein